ncbi:MAG: substrate-binding domain-containing protein [Anaerolineales bacterium]|nr:substrate-binding domain-containing protein [Anaerolineales bacterium]
MTGNASPAKKRKTIAALNAQLNRVWGNEFMAGVLDSARASDVNVLSFVGGAPVAAQTPNGISYGLYDLIKSERVDGVLLSADLAYGLSPQEIQKFVDFFAPIPVATFAIPAKNAPTILGDNVGGMRALTRHMLETHHAQRVAFVRGPRGQFEAEQRRQGFLDELKERNVRFDSKFEVEGDYSSESGRAAVRILLDERKLNPQAIVVSNDRMAFGVLEALQQRGVSVPEQIAVVGFDDVSESQSTGVPLTTVRQSFYDVGVGAFRLLEKQINGEKVAATTLLPTEVVVRWSCGCLPESINRAVVLPSEAARTGRLENKRDQVIDILLATANVSEDDPHRAELVEGFGHSWDVFLESLHGRAPNDAFLKTVQDAVRVLSQHGYELYVWQNLLSAFRKHALRGISDPATALRAENLFQQAQILIGGLSRRAQAYNRLQFVKQEELLNNFSFSMAPAVSFESIGDAISTHFPALGIERWYVMFYDEAERASNAAPQNYRLLMQFDNRRFEMPEEKARMETGRLTPRNKTPIDRRYDAVVMPLSLASNRFGFMWVEMGPEDWDVYVRVRNLLSSALLRTMLADQREDAKRETERLYSAEQARRHSAEALTRSARRLSSLDAAERLPEHILEQLNQALPYDRSALIINDVNDFPEVHAHRGMPNGADMKSFRLTWNGADFYQTVMSKGEIVAANNIKNDPNWKQPDWLPQDQSWLGAPLYAKNKTIGVLMFSRAAQDFSEDDILLAATFVTQVSVAWENARLYREMTDMNQMMERMVAQRVDELNRTYEKLEQYNKNKSAFIQVAAHELRTPLTVIKGFLGILQSNSSIKKDETLTEALDGVLRGTNRLHQIVNSMLDVVRLENQVITPHLEPVFLNMVLRLIVKDYAQDLATRSLNLEIDDSISDLPAILGDSELVKKAFDQIIVNAIKFTPDGGTISVSAKTVNDERRGEMAEIVVRDTGIGIDAVHHKVIFEKLYQLGEVQLHSSSRTNYKGGGAGLGLAIASGIVKALQGSIWVESAGKDEEHFPGSAFFVRLPLMKN